MIVHSRLVPTGASLAVFAATEAHIRRHISSVADPGDHPAARAADVSIVERHQDNGVLLVGSLDAEPQADYLRPDFDPERDVADNPLSVPSIQEGP